MSFATSFAKGKGFRTSPLCFPQGDDPSSEDDEEVDRILSKSHSVVSLKRSAHEDLQEEGDSPSENRRETHADKPVNVINWSPEQVKKWIFGLFGEAVAEKFLEEEIDGQALLESKRLEEDSTLEKLGIATIGKKERFKRELGAVKPVVNDNIHHFGKKKKIDSSSFQSLDRLLTREERQHLSCKDKCIYNTKKKRITREVERRWPKGSALPNYRNKTDAMEVDKFIEKMVQDETLLFPECGLQREAVLEIVLKKIREQRRQQKDIPLKQEDVLSTDSASESSSSPSPPSSQLDRVRRYNLYFDEDMTQSTAELIVMIVLGKSSIKDVKMDQLHKMRKLFNLGMLRGKDKMTHIRAIANSLNSEGYVTISEQADLGCLTRNDVKIAKELNLEDCKSG